MNIIGKPFSPSTIIESKEMAMTEIMISCGGGLGGSCWEVYTQDEFDLNNNFIKVNTNLQKETTLNTKNIVQVRPVRVFKIKVRNEGNYNIGKTGEVKEYYYLIEGTENVQVINEYKETSFKKIKFVK